ncbi:MAG TPA: hypothetical protein VIL46_15790 [Gemmataceae bacterium]
MPAITRREALAALPALAGACSMAEGAPPLRLATFAEEITPPLGHPLMGGGVAPAKDVDDPLYAHGIVLLGAGKPVVLCALDWCEVRNDAYQRWREALAEAAGTEPARVLLSCLHQHDAPVADLTAQRLLEEHKAAGAVCDLDFHERAVRKVAKAVRGSLAKARRVTHLGTGKAKVEKVASNRRFVTADGKVSFARMSATRDPAIRDKPEGTIDPWLRTLSFWDGDTPLAALSAYATHPMSYYGKGGVSADFVGMARRRRQADDPKVFQAYLTGCGGNVTAGKYNDGSPENRPVLADRIYRAMKQAWEATERRPVESTAFRNAELKLEARGGPGFREKDLLDRLRTDRRPFGQCLAALGLSWRKRVEAGVPIDVPAVDFGFAALLLLPAEAYVEYQLYARQARPGAFVLVSGYGECGPGYIPTEKHWREGDTNLSDWCWVAPGSERRVRDAIDRALKRG